MVLLRVSGISAARAVQDNDTSKATTSWRWMGKG
jgi:hypothetical protein